MSGTPESPRGRRAGSVSRPYLPLAVTLCIGIAASAGLFAVIHWWEWNQARADFAAAADDQASDMRAALGQNLFMLQSLAAFYGSSEKVERGQFREFVRHFLPHFRSVKAIEWVPRVRDGDREACEAAARQEGFPDFQITERTGQGRMVRAGRREEYFPVYFLEPVAGNETAPGFDVASDPVRRQAMEQARDAGRATATARVRLVQETGDQWGFLVFQPIYRRGAPAETVGDRRENLEGFALGVFRAGDFVEAALEPLQRIAMDVCVRDASAPDKPFLYCHARSPDAAPAGDVPAGPGAPYAGLFSSRTLEVAGRQWEIQCVPLPDWLAKHRAWLSWTVLAGGLLLTGLLSAYFVVSIGRTAKIHRLAAQLMEANGNLESANRRLAELATTDELTGLWNRRRFVELLAAEVERSRRYGANLALMMVDIDQFKSINDTCGHAFGDRVLVEVARLLRREARETDVVARYAGDEFMVLMPCTSAEEAVSAAERTRKKTAERHISDDTRCVRVTISTGIGALGPGPASTPEGLVRAADQALYVAKHSGRDCVRTWKQVASDEAAQAGTESEAVEDLRRKVARLSRRSRRLFMNRIRGLVNTMEARDPYAKSHSRNVARLAVGIARTLKLGRRQVASIHRAALIHDIGKIGVPDGILWKPGTLTPEERRVMQQHVLVGVHILGQMRFLESEIPIVRHHHERFDGHGYPDSISGEAIPLGARILAAADAFDAITGNRPYRTARELPQALRILIEESGHQFAPGVVDGLVQWVRATGHALGKHGTLTVEDLLASRLETAKVS